MFDVTALTTEFNAVNLPKNMYFNPIRIRDPYSWT